MDKPSRLVARRRRTQLSTGVVLLMSWGHVFAQAQQCANAAGQWTDSYEYAWSIQQNSSGLSGTVSTGCGIWNVDGVLYGDLGQVVITATNPHGGDEFCADWFSYFGFINKPGCHTGQGNWQNSAQEAGSWSWQSACKVPNQEFALFWGWADGEPEGGSVGKWRMWIVGDIDYGGRVVRESNTGGQTWVDTCWFPESIFLTGGSGANSPWDVQSGSRYGEDYIGYMPAGVTYYRERSALPCGFNFPQRMSIDCATGNVEYLTHPAGATIDATTVSSKRIATATRSWP